MSTTFPRRAGSRSILPTEYELLQFLVQRAAKCHIRDKADSNRNIPKFAGQGPRGVGGVRLGVHCTTLSTILYVRHSPSVSVHMRISFQFNSAQHANCRFPTVPTLLFPCHFSCFPACRGLTLFRFRGTPIIRNRVVDREIRGASSNPRTPDSENSYRYQCCLIGRVES
jgi:hypothetical protein